MHELEGRASLRGWLQTLATIVVGAVVVVAPGQAGQLPPMAKPDVEVSLSLDAAVVWALQNNPELTAVRQQHGIAAAGVVVARTYPYNPFLEARFQGVNGPVPDISNRVAMQHTLNLTVECCGQWKYRLLGARAALDRTEWEIAYQETRLAVQVARTFQGVVYRNDKLRFIEETVRLNEKAAQQVGNLLKQGKLTGADLILARTEIEDTRAQAVLARAALQAANFELRRSLGIVQEEFDVRGDLELAPVMPAEETLTAAALERRPDLQARRALIAEADARLRLTVADRFGSPTFSAYYNYDQNRVNFIGGQVSLPLPVFNTKKGEILQSEAQKTRAVLELRQLEVSVQQDVQAALARLKQAQDLVGTYATVVREMGKGLEEMERLFAQGAPGVDVLRVIDVRRKLLKAREGYLDALWELTQARADLAAAVGDLSLVLPGPPRASAMPRAKLHFSPQ